MACRVDMPDYDQMLVDTEEAPFSVNSWTIQAEHEHRGSTIYIIFVICRVKFPLASGGGLYWGLDCEVLKYNTRAIPRNSHEARAIL